jgi:hypothetical protein
MKIPLAVGLVASGKINPSLAKLPGLASVLGPVKSSSLRVASRFVNQLRAGRAVGSWAEFSGCTLILMSMPDHEIVAELLAAAAAPIHWHGVSVVLVGSAFESIDIALLPGKGPSLGTMERMEAHHANRFAVEGERHAVLAMKRFLRSTGAAAVEIKPGKKPLYRAGLAFAGTLFTPLVEAAVDCMRKSGLSSKDAVEFAEACFLSTLRSYVKAGKQGWQGPVAKRDLDAVRRLTTALGADNPLLGAYFSQTARMALDVFGQDKEWLEEVDFGSGPKPAD